MYIHSNAYNLRLIYLLHQLIKHTRTHTFVVTPGAYWPEAGARMV